eukprot:TRINITY_DN9690_c0_g1_i2.p1 TRINITY_DN9690_c0_g1~~TRINITY_DN9690_c0_g1_i2.p1  ORF type:complete len:189 (+),score=35.70 TRINITY_DN9690_c0_g1_i2:479-1045(+)
MEFMKGVNLRYLPPPVASLYLEDQNLLHSIGSAIVFDLMINNWDRFPLHNIYKVGNPKNLIFQRLDMIELHLIDHIVTPIGNTGLADNYFRQLKMIRNMDDTAKLQLVRPIKEFVMNYSYHEMLDEHLMIIVEGMYETIEVISSPEGQIFMENLFDSMDERVKKSVKSEIDTKYINFIKKAYRCFVDE